MKTTGTLLLAFCAFTAASILRDRRSADPLNVRPDPKEICAPETPCGWSVYRPNVKLIELNITNNYCECAVGTTCEMDHDDVSVHSYILHCRNPSEDSR